ncbi:MAG TPA: hypothetical protein VK184_25550 [Nostocaceae cyanobacterium]|nr:hypothetical protein [Nostocaceae cyanobacterium]
MSRDGFGSGFFAGALVGGVVGGILGAVLATRRDALFPPDDEEISSPDAKKNAARKRQIRSAANENLEMEMARRSLEDKIAQLNATIDDVRQQLGNVNGSASQISSEQRSLSQDS